METQTSPLIVRARAKSPHWIPHALLCAGALLAAGALTVEARLGPLAGGGGAPPNRQAPAAAPAAPADPVQVLRASPRQIPPLQPLAARPSPQAGAAPAVRVSGPIVKPAVSVPSVAARPAISEADLKNLAVKAAEALRAGDIGGARLVLERAASAGDPSALFALGETYDPSVLRKMRVRGLKGDVRKARELYLKASQDGVKQATARLLALGEADAASDAKTAATSP